MGLVFRIIGDHMYVHAKGSTFDLISLVVLPTDTWSATCIFQHGQISTPATVTVIEDTTNPVPAGAGNTNYILEIIIPIEDQANWPTCNSSFVGRVWFTGISGLVLPSAFFDFIVSE